MLRAFSVVYWAYAVAIMPPLMAGAILIWLVTLPFDRRRVVLHLYSCVWGSLYVWSNPLWRVRIEGREKLPWKGPAVLVANHLSLLDILVLYDLFRPFKWVAKAELFKVPFVGWNMWINDYVRVLRGDRESIKEMMDHCRRHLARGTPVLLFPEGTRSQDGRLQRFKDGAFRLATDAGCPLFPIAISGTFDALPKHGLVMRDRARILVKVLEPLHPQDFASSDALRDAARAAIAAALPEPARGDAGAPVAAPRRQTRQA
ncbi:MAG TPA: lysophospholipid acyltransferase family protein [Anaeromyxobacteraceae bacterium]|nr:lysophospholipid acyltransferase family protein [Anaeromyxobacteraceae bacterium]